MMFGMCEARGAKLYKTDERYCIDNGAMIAQAGALAYSSSGPVPWEQCTITQRYTFQFGMFF